MSDTIDARYFWAMEPDPDPDQEWWESFHREHGVPNPGNYSLAGHLAMIAGLFAALFPKRLRPVTKWPLILFVLLAFLVAYVLTMPVRLFNRLKRRFANPSS